jgi:hypothetical protein
MAVRVEDVSNVGEQSSLVPPTSATAGSLLITDFPESLRSLLAELDDSGDGVLDIDELSEMCQVYVDMKRATADGSIAITTLPKEIQPTLKAFDVDGVSCSVLVAARPTRRPGGPPVARASLALCPFCLSELRPLATGWLCGASGAGASRGAVHEEQAEEQEPDETGRRPVADPDPARVRHRWHDGQGDRDVEGDANGR